MSGGLWVDDCKPCPHGCAVARTYDDALRMLRRFDYDVLYLDHDLADHHVPERTGFDLLMQLIADNRVPPRVEIISWNPVGRKRLENALADLKAMRSGDARQQESCTDCGITLGGDEGDGTHQCSNCLGLRAHGFTWTCQRCGARHHGPDVEHCPCEASSPRDEEGVK